LRITTKPARVDMLEAPITATELGLKNWVIRLRLMVFPRLIKFCVIYSLNVPCLLCYFERLDAYY
jgi:hypothetical protein